MGGIVFFTMSSRGGAEDIVFFTMSFRCLWVDIVFFTMSARFVVVSVVIFVYVNPLFYGHVQFISYAPSVFLFPITGFHWSWLSSAGRERPSTARIDGGTYCAVHTLYPECTGRVHPANTTIT
jgi:hypothetical protein